MINNPSIQQETPYFCPEGWLSNDLWTTASRHLLELKNPTIKYDPNGKGWWQLNIFLVKTENSGAFSYLHVVCTGKHVQRGKVGCAGNIHTHVWEAEAMAALGLWPQFPKRIALKRKELFDSVSSWGRGTERRISLFKCQMETLCDQQLQQT